MSSSRILLLVHPFFRPDRKAGARSPTERHIWQTLKKLGYNCKVTAAQDDLRELDRDLASHRPHVVFNLLEEFKDEGVYDFHAVSFLEALGVPFTGCNPRGLIVSRNKFWTGHLAKSIGIRTPRTWMASDVARLADAPYPLILKYNNEHASLGMTLKNVVNTSSELRVIERRLRTRGAEVVAQEFIRGRELSVAVLGNRRQIVFHPWELRLKSFDAFATEKIKFSCEYRKRHGIQARHFSGPDQLVNELQSASRRLYRALKLSGYARFDFRLDRSGHYFLIDVNANPNLARDEDFARSAFHSGYKYHDLVRKIIGLAKDYSPVS